MVDGEYKRINNTLFFKNDESQGERLVLIHGYDNGWHGCKGNSNYVAPDCFPYNRWAYIEDLAMPIKGNVNMWSKKGDSSGYVKCSKLQIE